RYGVDRLAVLRWRCAGGLCRHRRRGIEHRPATAAIHPGRAGGGLLAVGVRDAAAGAMIGGGRARAATQGRGGPRPWLAPRARPSKTGPTRHRGADMERFIDPLAILIVAINFYALGASRIRALISAVALQGILLGLFPVLLHEDIGIRGIKVDRH